MGLGSLVAVIGGSLAGAIGNAISQAGKNQSSSTSKPSSSSGSSGSSGNSGSSGSSGSSTGSGSNSGYVAKGTWNDQGLKESNPGAYNQIQDYKNQYYDAVARGDKEAADAAHQAAEDIRKQFGYIGGSDGSQYIPISNGTGTTLGQQMGNVYQDTFDKYYGDEASAAREEAIKAAQQAAVEKNVLELEAQKGKVQQAGAEGNAAAQQAYMTAINPNGSLAESLAARGLLSSGLTESSQIAAGNAYQDALNNNKMTVTEQLAEIERAISQAKLSGDLATAEQLQAWYDTVANAAMQNASNIVSANQWANDFALSEAGVTGSYNGQATLAQKQFENETKLLERQLQAGQITQEQFNKQWQAEYETLLAQLQALELQNKYYQTQL